MPNKDFELTLRKTLKQSFREEIQPEKLEETIKLCTNIVRKQKNNIEENERTGFWQYLSDVFRFDGFPILGLQAAVLLFVCLNISFIAGEPANIPIFMPLFVLALLPVLFRSQYYKTSEIEAATRASGAQIVLAKLLLAGGANLVCITILLWLEISLQNSAVETGQLILYAIVPYLVCMALLLRNIRLQKNKNIQTCALEILGLSTCSGIAAKTLPKIYEASAMGIWITAFLIFGAFFLKEFIYILEMKKGGKIYGTIA